SSPGLAASPARRPPRDLATASRITSCFFCASTYARIAPRKNWFKLMSNTRAMSSASSYASRGMRKQYCMARDFIRDPLPTPNIRTLRLRNLGIRWELRGASVLRNLRLDELAEVLVRLHLLLARPEALVADREDRIEVGRAFEVLGHLVRDRRERREHQDRHLLVADQRAE